MNNLKHTPGPWSEKAIYYLLRFGDKHDGNWSDALYGIDEFMPCSEQDSRLIAAAPEMLEALIESYKYNDRLGSNNCYRWASPSERFIKDLIERATGLPIEEVLK